jgi:hypothetical protein
MCTKAINFVVVVVEGTLSRFHFVLSSILFFDVLCATLSGFCTVTV